jgi:hypothetical protein
MRWRKKTRRMRSIKSVLCFAQLVILGSVLLEAGDKKKQAEPDTVIAGSVFRDPGYALPDATVTLVARDDPKHKKIAQQETTIRGEFVFHVPAAPVVYVVKASAKGLRSQEKEASVTGPDRIELTFTLEPETRK